MMQRITFLMTTILTPFLIHSMDTPKYVIPSEITTHKKEVDKLYQTTYTMLQNFKPDDKKTAHRLIKIAEQMNCLRQAQITEEKMGFFVFNQKPSFSSTIKRSLFSDSSIDNFYASVFFASLRTYNHTLMQCQHISPNKTQINNHWKNNNIHKIVTTSATFGITIPSETLNEAIIPTLPAIGVTTFDLLMLHTEKLLQENPKAIKQTAKLIYHNELKTQSTQTPSNNLQSPEATH